MSMFLNMTLSTWGDLGNIILGITSVFTAIVTAVVLCKQHKLQLEQHKLEQEKLRNGTPAAVFLQTGEGPHGHLQ